MDDVSYISDSVWLELEGFCEYLNTLNASTTLTVSNTSIGSPTPTTFSRLQELPVELQMHIWSFALLAFNRPIKAAGKHYRAWILAPIADEWFSSPHSCFLTSPVSGNMIRFAGWNDRLWVLEDVCRVSRMLMLERWKRVIEKTEESYAWETEFKGESLVVLGDIIEGLRGRKMREVEV